MPFRFVIVIANSVVQSAAHSDAEGDVRVQQASSWVNLQRDGDVDVDAANTADGADATKVRVRRSESCLFVQLQLLV